MTVYPCDKGCCSIKIHRYHTHDSVKQRRRNYRKAGVFIYDSQEDRVLLVQSRGQLWGPPKGTLELGEDNISCAVREVKEETGLDIDSRDFTRVTKIKNRAVYYYLEMKTCPVDIQKAIKNNDANGITWIKVDCLQDCIVNGHIVLNQHCKIVFSRFLRKIFPKSSFKQVKSKSAKRKK